MMPTIASHRTGLKPPNRHKIPPKLDADGKRITADHSKLYGHKWRQARAIFLKRNPLCVHCKRDGKVTPATEVDHIIPHRGNLALFWDKLTNWMALCKPCHSKKTATEDGGFGNMKPRE